MNIESVYKKWCKLTSRNGGVLIGRSIREFIAYYEEQRNKKENAKNEIYEKEIEKLKTEIKDLEKFIDKQN